MFENVRVEGRKLTSGKKSEYFYDFDLLTMVEVNAQAFKLMRMIQDARIDYDFIVAPAIGGIVLGARYSTLTYKPMVITTKEGEIRGKPHGKKYIIIDDVVSTYGEVDSVKKMFPNHECSGVAAYIFRGKEKRPNTFVIEDKEVEE